MSRYGSIDIAVTPGTIRIALRGEIDASLAEDVQYVLALGVPAGSAVEVDARGVTFMDGYGLRMLAGLASRARRLVLRDPPQIVRFLLEVTDLGGQVRVESHSLTSPSIPTGTGPDRPAPRTVAGAPATA